jgi:DNA-binding GntR family transcriptional regulator
MKISNSSAMPTLTRNPVPSLNTGVYERLKGMIAERKIEPGARLVQQTLAKQLGTSAMPVVEALRRLERDGLVVHMPHFGSFVRESTVEDLRELYSIRRGLEGEACRLFVQRATAEERDELARLNARLNAAAREENIDRYISEDLQFHMHIVTAARVPRIKEMIESRHVEERIFQNAPELQMMSRGTAHLIGQHDAIVQAILQGDEDAAAEAMRQHLLKAEREYLEAVREQNRK